MYGNISMSPLVFTTDKFRLFEHFKKDPILFGYHIGDLDDFYFEHCQWGVSYPQMPRIEEAILVYSGGHVPSVLAFGLTDKFDDLLKEMLPLLPPKFHSHFNDSSRHVFLNSYSEKSLGTYQKMKLIDFNPQPCADTTGTIIRLDDSHKITLLQFYKESYPGNYFHDRMLASGKYFGCFENNSLLSVAGVHVYSREYKIAVLGNIATHPDHRGNRLAAILTSHLIEELSNEGLLVALNVKCDNEYAIRCYEKLGFQKQCEYEESLFSLTV